MHDRTPSIKQELETADSDKCQKVEITPVKETRKEFSGTLEGLKKVDRECQALCRDQNLSFVANSHEALRAWSATKQ